MPASRHSLEFGTVISVKGYGPLVVLGTPSHGVVPAAIRAVAGHYSPETPTGQSWYGIATLSLWEDSPTCEDPDKISMGVAERTNTCGRTEQAPEEVQWLEWLKEAEEAEGAAGYIEDCSYEGQVL